MGCSGSHTNSSKNLKYCISVDGSDHSELGFKKIINENFKKGNKLYLLHIFNSKKFDEIPSEYLPDNIIKKYENILSEKYEKNEFEIIKQEKQNREISSLQSVVEIATKKNIDLLVVGAVGHKGLKKSKSITTGINYLILNCKIPVLVMREYHLRDNLKNEGNIWLMCIKDDNDRSFRSFDFSMKLINRERDFIIALHFYSEKFLADVVKNNFIKRCKENNIKKRNFIARDIEKHQTLGKNILDYLTYGQEKIDYIVLNHNIQRYTDIEKCPSVELIKFSNNNILFCRE